MSHLFSVPYQPVVGTLGKFPNRQLFWSQLYFSIGKLQATIKILISTQLSIKSIFSNIINISHWQNFAIGSTWCSNFTFNVLPNGKFLLFLFLFGMLAVKAMAFWEILLSSHQNLPFLNVSNKLSNLIPPSYGLHFGKYKLGIIGVKYTVFMQNAM